MKTVSHIVNQLKAELNEMGNIDLTACHDYKESLNLVNHALQDLKVLVLNKDFSSIEEEVEFFKNIKPFIMSRFLFLTFAIRHQELKQLSPQSAGTFIQKYKKEHRDFLEEYKVYLLELLKNNPIDEQRYFVRNKFETNLNPIYSKVMLNNNFCTFHSELSAIFESKKMIQNYIQLQEEKMQSTILDTTNLQWTDKKTALIELMYGLHFSNAVNNGRISIKELKLVFEKIFNVDLGNVYRAFHEIKNRDERTVFIDYLKVAMENKLDEDDAFIPK